MPGPLTDEEVDAAIQTEQDFREKNYPNWKNEANQELGSPRGVELNALSRVALELGCEHPTEVLLVLQKVRADWRGNRPVVLKVLQEVRADWRGNRPVGA